MNDWMGEWAVTSNDVGLSAIPFHDYTEHKTPSYQYGNGPITSFWGIYRPSKAVPSQTPVKIYTWYEVPG